MRRLFTVPSNATTAARARAASSLPAGDTSPTVWRAMTAACTVIAALVLAFPVSAAAGTSEVTKIYEEACSNGKIPIGYTQQAYTQAIKEMEPFLAEYTDCPDLIHKAQLAGAAGSRGVGASGGAGETGTTAVAPPTPTEQHTLESIPHANAPPVQVGGQVIHPGVVHVNLASAFNTLPTPLLALLAFLLACALLVVAWAVRRRVGRAGAQAGGDSIAGE